MPHLNENQLTKISMARAQGQELYPWVTDHLAKCWQCRYGLELEDGWTSELIDGRMEPVSEPSADVQVGAEAAQ